MNEIPLRQDRFIELLDGARVSPEFVDVLIAYDGAYIAFPHVSGSSESFRKSFSQFILKFAEPFLDVVLRSPQFVEAVSLALYFRYDFASQSTTILIIGPYTDLFQSSFQQLYNSTTTRKTNRDPFAILSTLVADISFKWKQQCAYLVDVITQEEAKTGWTSFRHDSSLRIQNFSNQSARNLHIMANGLQLRGQMIRFNIGWIEFLIEQHRKISAMRKARIRPDQDHLTCSGMAEEETRRSLDLSLSFACNRHKSMLQLIQRINTQVKIVDNMIAQADTRTSLALADQSRQIAIDTKKDSIAMKTIAAMTMFFLPGTFVAVRFASLRYSSPMWQKQNKG